MPSTMMKPGRVAPQWEPDEGAICCHGCTRSFGLTTRRHHCRACGKIFCGDCSSKRAKLDYIEGKEARVCKNCFDAITKDAQVSMGAGIGKPQPDGRGGIRIHLNPGNHHTSPQFGNQPFNSSTNNGNRMQTKPEPTSCEECTQSFSAFKRKKPCKDCSRLFCSSCCVSGGSSSPRLAQCKKCQILLTGTFSRSLLSTWKVKDLKALLNKQNINTSKCKEKDDLIELIFVSFGGNPNYNRQSSEQERFVEELAERMRQEQQSEQQSNTPVNQSGDPQSQSEPVYQQATPSTNMPQNSGSFETANGEGTAETAADSGTGRPDSSQERLRKRQEQEMREAEARLRQELEANEADKSSSNQENPNLKLSDIKSEAEIEELNIKALKRILINNFVDFKGCCERWELQERVKRLWVDNENNKRKAEEVRLLTDDPSSVPGTSTSTEDDICKICMDAAIDCVLLECGHMVTCTQCGKRLAECPICRQYVIRAVHTFRS